MAVWWCFACWLRFAADGAWGLSAHAVIRHLTWLRYVTGWVYSGITGSCKTWERFGLQLRTTATPLLAPYLVSAFLLLCRLGETCRVNGSWHIGELVVPGASPHMRHCRQLGVCVWLGAIRDGCCQVQVRDAALQAFGASWSCRPMGVQASVVLGWARCKSAERRGRPLPIQVMMLAHSLAVGWNLVLALVLGLHFVAERGGITSLGGLRLAWCCCPNFGQIPEGTTSSESRSAGLRSGRGAARAHVRSQRGRWHLASSARSAMAGA